MNRDRTVRERRASAVLASRTVALKSQVRTLAHGGLVQRGAEQ